MISFLTRGRPKAAPATARFVRPCLEGLEDRLTPTSLSLNYQIMQQNGAQFMGQLSGGTNVANQKVTITGPGGFTTTATTDNNGFYHFMAATKLGNYVASVSDPTVSQATVSINPPAPTITDFVCIALGGGMEELKGVVTGTPDPMGMTITFGGVLPNTDTATVGAGGTFDVTFMVGGLHGPVTAQTVDWWNQSSNTALVAM